VSPLDSSAVGRERRTTDRAHVDYAAGLIASLPPPLLTAVREPYGARNVVYALLLDPDPAVRSLQRTHLENVSERGTVVEVEKLRRLIEPLGDSVRLPLVELGLPALRQLSGPQYRQFREVVDFLASADRKFSLFEYALKRMLLRHLDRYFGKRPPAAVQAGSVDALIRMGALVLSALATRAMTTATTRCGPSRRGCSGSACPPVRTRSSSRSVLVARAGPGPHGPRNRVFRRRRPACSRPVPPASSGTGVSRSRKEKCFVRSPTRSIVPSLRCWRKRVAASTKAR